MRLVSLLILLALLLPLAGPSAPTVAQSGPADFVATFDGNPAGPQPWNPPDWDVAVHSRDRSVAFELDPMDLHHGADCGPHPATHRDTTYAGAVFLCRDHLMTAINGRGYALISLTPDRALDFAQGEGVIRFDVSTHFSVTPNRDWWDVWIVPFEDNVSLPFDDFGVDLNGPPARAINFRMHQYYDGRNMGPGFKAAVYRDYNAREYTVNAWTPYNSFLTPSATTRTTVELRVSRTRLKMCFTAYNFCYVDNAIPDLGWTRGVVKLAHHSYNPEKDGQPNTWHWDNLSISPAVPFALLNADRRYVRAAEATRVTYPAPAPAGSDLIFSAIGDRIDVSFDEGATWTQARKRCGQFCDIADHFANYAVPVPTGTQAVRFRGADWWGGPWMAKDVTIYGRPGGAPPPATVPPPTPANTATAVVAATATAVVAATATTVAAATATTIAATATAQPSPTIGPTPPPPDTGHVAWRGRAWYLHGANLPWVNWARDFGGGTTDGVRATEPIVREAFRRARAAGLINVRWWLFPGAPWQIERDASNMPTGVNAAALADLDRALVIAREEGVVLHMTLFSGPLDIPPDWRVAGAKRDALAMVLGRDLFARYATNDQLMTWEVINEPEWHIWGGQADAGQLQALVRAVATASRDAAPLTHVTVGSAIVDGLPLWLGLGLTYYQAHWYGPMASGDWCARCRTYADVADQYGIDLPLVIGEFSPADAADDWEVWKRNGYAGAWGWSLLPERTADRLAVNATTARAFADAHADVGPMPPTGPPATATAVAATATAIPAATATAQVATATAAATATSAAATATASAHNCRVDRFQRQPNGTFARVSRDFYSAADCAAP